MEIESASAQYSFTYEIFSLKRVKREPSKSRNILIPTKLSQELEQWSFQIGRQHTLQYFKALMDYISHFRGGKIHHNLQRAISDILIKLSQWKVQLQEFQSQIQLSMVELSLRATIYELESVEKQSDFERILELLHDDPQKIVQKIPLLINILSLGHTNLFAVRGSEETKRLLNNLNKDLSILKKEKDIMTQEQIREMVINSKNTWLDLNKSVIYDYRIYYARRVELIQKVALLRQFTLNYPNETQNYLDRDSLDEFTENVFTSITPENIDDMEFAQEKFHDDYYHYLKRELEKVEEVNNLVPSTLINFFERYFNEKSHSFRHKKSPDLTDSYELLLPGAKSLSFDFSRPGFLTLSGTGQPEKALQIADEFAQPLLFELAFELSPTLAG